MGHVQGERVCVYARDCISSQKNLDKLGTRECRDNSYKESLTLNTTVFREEKISIVYLVCIAVWIDINDHISFQTKWLSSELRLEPPTDCSPAENSQRAQRRAVAASPCRGLTAERQERLQLKIPVLRLSSDEPQASYVAHPMKEDHFGQAGIVGNALPQLPCREKPLVLVDAVQRHGAQGKCRRRGVSVVDKLVDIFLTPQGWRLNHFPGQPVPVLDNPFSEEKFPNIRSKPPLVQLETISSCPIACYLAEETDPHLSTTSFQAKQPQFPQPLLIRLLLQTLHQLRCPSLDTLQHLNVSLVVGGPKLNTVFEAAINQHPQVLLYQAAFQPLFPKPVALHGVAVAQVQDLALGLVKPHTIHPSPSIQPVQVPLQSLPTLQQINTPTQLGVICKLTEGALDPFVQIIDKNIKQNWSQHRALGNTACDRPPTGVNSIHHHSLGPAIQPVLYPAKSTPVQAMSSQFLQENAVGNCVKGFTEV
ncbi:hypothetical protein QYF61_027656 [Mycteria americana]|uniref:Uncharacterized protein n=1 Tax=Mycteria americana TaxID=33587 RepID=A0AAN7NPE4_MYCAM|nr:hypothetical protein QYF61_027656 [Mycteria americana]